MNEQQNQRLIGIVEKKISFQQNILCVIRQIFFFPMKNPNSKKIQDSLIISTHNIYFIYNNQIKKIVLIKHINCMTLAILGKQIILHSQKGEWFRIQSSEIINIIGNILLAKEKFLLEKGSFTVHLQIEKTLEEFTSAQNQKKSFFSIFKKNDKKTLTASGRRVSFCTIQVNEKNFILQIGKKCYKAIFQNAQLLHISGNATGFRFDAQNYEYRDLSRDDTLYWRQDTQKNKTIKYLRRKINKVSKTETQIIRKNLSTYRYNDYNEDIIFALELDTHFQVITEVFDSWIYCWEYLIHHNNYERSLINGNENLTEEVLLTETQLRSIFYKLHTFVEQESKKCNILSSLSLDYVYISNGDARISTVFCKILSKINVSYIAPQQLKSINQRLKTVQPSKSSMIKINQTQNKEIQMNGKTQEDGKKIQQQKQSLDSQYFGALDVYKINLWKLGIFLYQLAYHKLPFPIQYVAYKMLHHEHIKVHFPERDRHSIQFHHFLKSLICKDPMVRGMRCKGDARMSVLNPQISNIMEHEWFKKKRA